MTQLRFLLIALLIPTAVLAEVGIDERLGETVPLDLKFEAEDGSMVRLGDLVDRPVILTLVYYRCPNICNVLLAGLSDTMDRMEWKAGQEFRVVSISFNEAETAEVARRKKGNYFKRMAKAPPEDGWRYLCSTAETSRAITEATGFKYERTGEDFNHAAALIILSPEGKITRYLYGVEFLPFDVKMALTEAAEGRTGPTINRLLVYCFSYDPEGKTYVFNMLKVTGTLTMVILTLFVVLLVITTRRTRRKREEG